MKSSRQVARGDLAISARNVHKRFGEVKAIDGLSLQVKRGEMVALLGPNGSGKTTLTDMFLGFSAPDAGTVEILGYTPIRSVRSGKVGAVLQTGALLDTLNVIETLRLISKCQRRSISAEAAMERAGISHLAKRKVGACSGGEQQRIRFALAMLTEPDLIFLDEPTAAMDVAARREFWEAIQNEARCGRTAVFATHFLQEATDYADRIILLRDGQICKEGTVEELTSDYEQRLSCTWTAPSSPENFAATYQARVQHKQGNHVEFMAKDSDSLAREILNRNLAHTLTIHRASLDEVFMELTSETATHLAAAAKESES